MKGKAMEPSVVRAYFSEMIGVPKEWLGDTIVWVARIHPRDDVRIVLCLSKEEGYDALLATVRKDLSADK